MAIGDVNGDGYPDLIVGDYGGSAVNVLLGNGNGTFQSPGTFSTGSEPYSVAIGDLNGDGIPDLVVADKFGAELSVLLGNGNGTFQAQQTIATGTSRYSIALGDVNGDGKLDLITANGNSDTVSVLLGNGNGTFQSPHNYGTTSKAFSAVLGDLNGDGKLDIAVTDEGNSEVSVLLGNGNGTFQTQQSYAVGTSPTSVAIGDVNGDGKADLVVTNEASNTVSVLLGNGNGTFETQQTFAAGSGPRAVAFGDLNGDGRPDLAVADQHGNTASVLLNAAINGSFQGQTYTILQIESQTDPYVVSINRTSPATSTTNAASVSYTATFSEPVTGVSAAAFQTVVTGSVTAATPVVVSGSGSVYTVAVNGIAGSGTLGLNLIDNGSIHDLAGNPLTQQNSASAFQTQTTFATGSTPVSVAVADVNGDGIPDLVVANYGSNSVGVLLGNGNGTFRNETIFATSTHPFSVSVVDLNGDGIPDLVVANRGANSVGVLLGNGNGTFQAQTNFATGTTPVSVAVADVNSDGKPDLAVANEASNTVSVLLDNGIGAFQAEQTFATGATPFSVAAADVNGDGIPDLVIANDGSNSVSVLLGNGNGTFHPQTAYPTGSLPLSVAVADVNGDGIPDLLVANYNSSSVSVLLGNGNGTFQAQTNFATGSHPYSVSVADINGDGKLDLIVANKSSNTVGVLVGNGNGTFQAQTTFATGSGPQAVAVADINSDGRLDLIVANKSSNTVSVLLGSGNGNFTGQVFAIDRVAPYVQSINRTTPSGSSTNGSSVAYTVTFSESVTGVNATDFTLSETGTVATTSLQVTLVSGSVYTASINGITGNGTLGLNLVNNGSILDLAGNPLSSGVSFQPQQTFAAGSAPTAVTVGDVNGDGNPDLLVANYGSSSVSLLLGNGNGSFQGQQTSAAGSTPSSLALGDVNGDSNADLLVTNLLNSTISVLLSNGNGSFQARQTVSTGSRPNWVAAQDVNGDGNLDLVVANSSNNSVGVLLGNGNGSFQSQAFFAVGSYPVAVVVTDVNGDGKPDLVVANEHSNTVSVLLGNGNGTFQNQKTFATGSGPGPIAVVDFNGDGKPDIVVGNFGTNTVSVLLGNGNGTFKAQQTVTVGSAPRGLAVGDVNGDGVPDLVVTSRASNSLSVLLGNGDGTFRAQQTFATGAGPTAVTLADGNGDGKPDIFVANGSTTTVSEFLNSTNGTFTGQVYTIDLIAPTVSIASPGNNSYINNNKPTLIATAVDNTGGSGLASVQFQYSSNGGSTWSNASTAETSTPFSYAFSTALADGAYEGRAIATDNAGNSATSAAVTFTIDTVAPFVQSINRTTPSGATTNATSVSYTVTFSEPVTGVAPSDFSLATTGTLAGTVSQVTSVSGSVYTITVSGIAGDGTLGLNLVDNGSIHDLAGNLLMQQNAAASFQTRTVSASGPIAQRAVAVADVNGDGIPDVVLAIANSPGSVSVLLGNGNGTFQAPLTFALGSPSASIAVSDVNGDGKPDLIVAYYQSSRASVLLGNGNGTFQAAQTFAVGSAPSSVAVSDLNGDGKPDLIVANYLNANVSVLLGNGNGTFQAPQTFATGSQPTAVAVSDLNGDGVPDLTVVNQGSTSVSVLLGNGNGTFQAQQTFATSSGPRSVAVSDLNGDGKPDLIVADALASSTVSVLLGNGNGTFQAQQTFATGFSPLSVAVSDLNADGKPDLVVANFGSNNLSVLLGNGNGTFQAQQTFATGVGPYSMAVDDLNADGKPDLVVANVYTSNASVLLGNGNGTFQAQQTVIAGLGPFSVAVGDVSGDDKPDLVVANGSSATLSVLLSNGNGTFQAQTTVGTGSAPEFIALADVNGDGRPDLVSANYGSNSVSVLLGNGNGTFQAQQTFAVGSAPIAIALADLNGDDIPDLIVANEGGNSVSVLLGNGNGTFQAPVTFATGSAPVSVAVADVNGDGALDLIVANEGANSVSVLLNNGNGTFQTQQTFATGSEPRSVAVADVNGDGDPDLVVANYGSNTVSVLLGNGNGTFQTQQTFATGSGPRSVAAARVNGDGNPDLVVANYGSNTVGILLGNGNGTFQSQTTFATGTFPSSVAVADVNGDGKSDVLVANDGSNTVGVLLGNGNDNFTGQIYTIDQTPPTATISAEPPASTTNTSASFSFTGSDPISNGVSSGVNYLQYELDNGGFVTATSPVSLTSLAEGSHTFQVRAVDNAGNIGAAASYTWTIDLTAPTASITTQPPAFTNSTSAGFSFNGSDPTSGGVSSGVNHLEYQIDGSGFATGTSPASFTSLSEGSHTFQVRAVDNVGNVGTATTYTWTIDTTAPTASITAQPPSFSNSTSASFSFSGSDPTSGGVSSGVNDLQYQLDGGGFTVATSPLNLTGLSEGSHTFQVRAVDNAGNIGTSATYTWTIDLTAPTASITAQPPSVTNSTSASFSFSGSDPTSGGVSSGLNHLETKLDSGSFTTATSPFNLTGLSEGSHTFQVRAVDNAGNIGTAASYTWAVDLTPPTASITTQPPAFTNSTSAGFSFNGSDPTSGGVSSGVNHLEYQLDGSGFATGTSPASFTSLSEGSHTFQVRAVDNAGNVGTAASYTWTIDLTAPTASITAQPPSVTNSTSASFSFGGSDPTAGGVSSGVNDLQYQLDGGGFTVATSPLNLTGLSEGSHTFQVCAVDNAGNIGTAASYTWTVDLTAPIASITVQPPSVTNSTSASFSFNGSDPTSGGVSSGVNHLEYQLDGSGFATGTSPASFTGLSEGSHTFQVRAVDDAGNVGTAASFTWTVDLTSPTASITARPPAFTNSTSASLSFNGSDPTSGGVSSGVNHLEYQLDGSGFATGTSPASLTSLSEGSHSFQVRAVDNAGNVGTAATYTWTIDLTAPTASITAQPPSVTNSTSASFSFSGRDPTSGGVSSGVSDLQYQLDGGGFTVATSPLNLTGLSEGSHTFQVSAVDNAGNIGTAATYTWTIDLTSPTASITTQPPAFTNSTSASFSFNGSDPISGGVSSGMNDLQYQLDGGGFTVATSPLNLTGLSEGSHTFQVRAVDNAGNIGTSASYTWTIDLTPPTVSISAQPPLFTNSTSASFNFTGIDPTSGGVSSGVNHLEYQLDGSGFATGTSPASFTSLSEGSHTFQVRAVDNAGNIGTATSYTWTIDLTAPTASITAQPPTFTNSTSASFSFTGSDPTSNGVSSGVNDLQYELDNGGFTTGTSPASFTGLSEGSHTFQVRAVDNAGNIGAAASYSWIVDLTAPTASITAQPPSFTNSTSASFSFSGNDPTSNGVASGVSDLQYQLDGGGFAVSTSPVNLTSLSQGSHTFQVRAVDDAGNIGTATSYSWTVDLTAPTSAVSALPPVTTTTSFTVSWSGVDNAGGSGIASYSVFVSDNGSAFTPFQTNTTQTSATFNGAQGHTYGFSSIATDNVGNQQSTPTVAQASTTVLLATAITSAPAATFSSSQAGNFTVTTTGAPIAAIVENGLLPTGITFHDNGDGTASLSGTLAPGSGTYVVNITANNGNSPVVTQVFTLTVLFPPTITSANNATFKVGTAGSFTPKATAGFPTTTTITETGKLPSGVTFASGKLSGTPAAGSGGNYPITFTARNSQSSSTQAFTLTVDQAPAITSANKATFIKNQAGTTFTIKTTGFPFPAITSGVLPTGLSLTDNHNGTATLSGAPTTTGNATVTLTAANGIGTNATQTLTLTLAQAPTITSANIATFNVGTAGSFTPTATAGFPTTTTFTETGKLPSGVTFTSGKLGGTPAAGSGGTYPITFTAGNGSASSTQSFTLTVDQAPAITSASKATFIKNQAGTTFTITTTGFPAAAITSGTLPSGLTLTDNHNGTATLSGTATVSGSIPVTIMAANGIGANATQTLTLTLALAPTFTSVSSATFKVGTVGSFTPTATPGFPATTTFTESGKLPSGVTFTSGKLSGTPAASSGGTYPITLTAGNGSASSTQAFTLTVDQAPAISSANKATFIKGQAGSFTITTTGFPAVAITSGALPNGLTLTDNPNGTATLSGAPTTTGTATVTLTAANGIGTNATQTLTLTLALAPTFTSVSSATFKVGTAGTFMPAATPGFPATTTFTESGKLPSGVTFASGKLSGTPAAASGGTYPITLTAGNGSASSTQAFTLTVDQAPAISSANKATFIKGQTGSFTITTTGFPAAAITSGALPNGLTLTDNPNGTATLSGAPTTTGTTTVTLTAANGIGTNATQTLTLTLALAPAFTSPNNATFKVGTAGSFTPAATAGFPATTTFTETGKLPSGVTFTSGKLSGTPAAGTGGIYPITFTAGNGSASSTQAFTLTVNQALAITSANKATFVEGQAGSFSITTTGFPVAAIQESGTLPTGLTLVDNPNGTATLSGTPYTAMGGNYTLTITASDGVLPNATQTFTLTVDAPPAFTSVNSASFTANTSGSFTVTTTGFPVATIAESGTLPTGLTLVDNHNGTATLSGKPTAKGTFTITLSAIDGAFSASEVLTITVS